MEPAPERRCVVCGLELEANADARKRYCSPRCRQVAFRRRTQSPRLRLVVDEALAGEPSESEEGDEDERLQAALMGAVLRGSQTDWRAARWLLEIRWPERFGALRP